MNESGRKLLKIVSEHPDLPSIFFLEAESSGDTEKTMDLPDYR